MADRLFRPEPGYRDRGSGPDDRTPQGFHPQRPAPSGSSETSFGSTPWAWSSAWRRALPGIGLVSDQPGPAQAPMRTGGLTRRLRLTTSTDPRGIETNSRPWLQNQRHASNVWSQPSEHTESTPAAAVHSRLGPGPRASGSSQGRPASQARPMRKEVYRTGKLISPRFQAHEFAPWLIKQLVTRRIPIGPPEPSSHTIGRDGHPRPRSDPRQPQRRISSAGTAPSTQGLRSARLGQVWPGSSHGGRNPLDVTCHWCQQVIATTACRGQAGYFMGACRHASQRTSHGCAGSIAASLDAARYALPVMGDRQMCPTGRRTGRASIPPQRMRRVPEVFQRIRLSMALGISTWIRVEAAQFHQAFSVLQQARSQAAESAREPAR